MENQKNDIDNQFDEIKSKKTDSIIMEYYKKKFNNLRKLMTNFINKMSRDDIRNIMLGKHKELLNNIDIHFDNLENELYKIKYKINEELNVKKNISEDKIEKINDNDVQNKVINDLTPFALMYYMMLEQNNKVNEEKKVNINNQDNLDNQDNLNNLDNKDNLDNQNNNIDLNYNFHTDSNIFSDSFNNTLNFLNTNFNKNNNNNMTEISNINVNDID